MLPRPPSSVRRPWVPILAALTLLAVLPVAAIPPDLLLADLGTEAVDGDARDDGFPLASVVLDGRLVFVADHPHFGTELWTTDGTEQGTRLLRDVCPGSCSSEPASLVRLGDRGFFLADDGVFGRELWATDGTSAGTLRVRDLRPGPLDAAFPPSGLAVLGDRLLVAARNADDRPVLWTSDGTPAGTRRLAPPLGPPGADPVQLLAGETRAWLLLRTEGRHELWTTDGTGEGTRRLLGDAPGSFLQAVLDDRLYFRFLDGFGSEPWVSDGTPSGTGRLGDLCPGSCNSFPEDFFRWNGAVYFTAREGDVSNAQRHLWRTDGTAEGTGIALRGDRGGRSGIRSPLVQGDRLLFLGYVPQPSTLLVHVADAGLGESRLLRSFSTVGAEITRITAGGRFFLAFNSANRRTDVWTVGEAPSDSRRLATFEGESSHPIWWPAVSDLSRFGDRVVFFGRRPETGRELWISDGHPASTLLVRDIHREQGSSDPEMFRPVRDALAFVAEGDAPGLRVTDGTPEGTGALEDGPPAPLGLGTLPTPDGPDLLFAGSPFPPPFQGLFRSDGTTAGTLRIEPSLRWAQSFAFDGERVWFAGYDDDFGDELWTTDGSPEGTALVADALPGIEPSPVIPCCPASSFPRELTPLGGELVYRAASRASLETGPDLELWKSDGTVTGTRRLADLCPGPCSGDPRDLVSLGDAVVFTAVPAEGGPRRLWRTDGSPAGTVPVDGEPVGPRLLRRVGDRILFVAGRGPGASEALWSTDGTTDGTWPVHELTVDGLPSFATEAVSLSVPDGPILALVVANEATGAELWISDGTPQGTRILADLRRGPASSFPRNLTAIPGPLPGRPAAGDSELLVFAADDGTGSETWLWDGETLGLVADLAGPEPSLPGPFARVGDRLVFSARDEARGREPRTLDLARPDLPDPQTLELLDGRFEVRVDWRNQHDDGATGSGVALPYSDDTGFFWFFAPGNVEYAVKVLDGSAINGHAWVFTAGLSDVESTVTVLDRVTGAERTWRNEPGEICGDADVEAFPLDLRSAPSARSSAGGAPRSGCDDGDPEALCLLDQRFRVEVDFVDPADGVLRVGKPVSRSVTRSVYSTSERAP